MPDPSRPPNLRLTGLCNRISIVTDNQPQAAYVLVELRSESETTLPANLAIITDSGRQLGGKAWESVKTAICELIDTLQPEDHLALVNLAIPPQVVIPAQKVENPAGFKDLVKSLATSGVGSLTAGIEEATRQLQSKLSPERASFLLVVLSRAYTDEWETVSHAARQARALGIHVLGLGAGNEWNEELLSNLINLPDAETSPQMPTLVQYAPEAGALSGLMKYFARTIRVTLRDARLSAWFMRGVKLKQIWQVRPNISCLGTEFFQGQSISAPVKLLDQNSLSLLVDIELPPRSIGPVRIARLQVHSPTETGQNELAGLDLVVNYSQDTSMTNPLDNYVMDHVERVQAYDLRIQALADLDAGNVQASAQKLRQATAILASQGNTTLADRIRGEVDFNLRQYGQISSEGRKFIALLGRQPA